MPRSPLGERGALVIVAEGAERLLELAPLALELGERLELPLDLLQPALDELHDLGGAANGSCHPVLRLLTRRRC
jgi:hypothetical protein